MDQHLTEKLIAGETVYDGKVVHLEKWVVELPNGRKASREIIRHVGAAGVLAVDDQGLVTLVRQFRAALGCVTLEIPAGKLSRKDDDPLLAAMRELSEETGLQAEDWRHLTRIYTTVGFCDERIELYMARGLHQGTEHPDDDEFVEVVRMPLSELREMALRGELTDAKTCVAVLMACDLV